MEKLLNLIKRRPKRLWLGIAACLLCLNVRAAGIPVIDVASLQEQIRSYIQQIADYQVYLDQLNVQDNQYVQMVMEYRQTILEYQHFLNQIKELDLAAWQRQILEETVQEFYGNFTQGVLASLNPQTDTQFTSVILRQENLIPRTVSDFQRDYRDLGLSNTNAIAVQQQRLERESQAYQNQISMVQDNNRNDKLVRMKQEELLERLNSLGPESDLATLQLQARQNHLLSEQLQQVTRQLNQQLLTYETPSQATNRLRIESMERELARLQRVKQRMINDRRITRPAITSYGDLIQ